MSRIKNKFTELKEKKKFAFMPFMVAGDPDFNKSLVIVKELVRHSDLLELGFPFSDPLADGPTIQNANKRVLAAGMTTNKVFSLIKKIRKFSSIPITILVYSNLIFQQGIQNFYKKAAASGIDGVLVPDLPIEEAELFIKYAKKYKVDPILLVTQTTSNTRLKKIIKVADGFLYLVNVLGITGEKNKFSKTTYDLIRRVKKQTKLPVAAGFGVSSRAEIQKLKRSRADGAIVGSFLIRNIHRLEPSIKKLISNSN